MKRFFCTITLLMLLTGCAGTLSSIDQAIQYRSGFNTMLSQWNIELATLPPVEQKVWANQALPYIKAGVMALDTMDIVIQTGNTPSPENVQAYLQAKNAMIDLLAKLILTKKGA
jgi:hypothetical protein